VPDPVRLGDVTLRFVQPYRGYLLVLGLSGPIGIETPGGELVDTQPTARQAKAVIDEWLNAR
jgi:hypothetical protein